MSYVKLFQTIVTSSVWSEDDRTRIVWITMLACADKHGEVQASIPGLARIAGVPVEDCRAAIAKFLAPDPDSRTKDDEGRRIEPIDGGWLLLNHKKYREMANDEDRRRQAVVRQQRSRERKSRNGHASVTPCHAAVTQCSRQISQAEADADVLLEKEPKGATAPRGGSKGDDLDFTAARLVTLGLIASPTLRQAWDEWQAYRQRRHAAKGRDHLAWTAQAARLSAGQVEAAAETYGSQIVSDRITAAIAGNWQGLNLDKLNTAQNGTANNSRTPRQAPIVTRNTAAAPGAGARPSLNSLAAGGLPDPQRRDPGEHAP